MFCPGAIAVFVFYKLNDNKIEFGLSATIASIVISYVLSFVLNTHPFWVCVVAAILGAATRILISHDYVKHIFGQLFNYSPTDNIWDEVLDLYSGTYLRIYLKNKSNYYIGIFSRVDKHNNDGWIAIRDFKEYDKETNEETEDGSNMVMVVNLNQISNIVVIYPDESETKKYLFHEK